MMSRPNRSAITISLVLLFSITQVSLVRGFAPQQPSGVLSTQGNQPITVNGIATNAGATILTGATVETPAGVTATINFGPLGSLSMSGDTSVRLDFEEGRIKVTVLRGCVELRTNEKTRGELETSRGIEKRSDGSKNAELEICAPGAAAPPTGDTGGWWGPKVLVPLFAGTAGVLIFLSTRSDNPSPTTP